MCPWTPSWAFATLTVELFKALASSSCPARALILFSSSSAGWTSPWPISAAASHAWVVRAGGPWGATSATEWSCCIVANASVGTISICWSRNFEELWIWKFPQSRPPTKMTLAPTSSGWAAIEVSHQFWCMAASWANCSVCSGPSTLAPPRRTSCMVLTKLGPEIWLTVSHVAGTDARAALTSILLLASLNRNSMRSASLPTASSEALEHTRSSHLERAKSPATTVPFGPTEYVLPPHWNDSTETLQPWNIATTTESLGVPTFTVLIKTSSTNCCCTVRSVSVRYPRKIQWNKSSLPL